MLYKSADMRVYIRFIRNTQTATRIHEQKA